MAAHVKTAIASVKQDTQNPNRDNFLWSSLQAALDIACWTEDLDFDHYCKLQKIVTARDAQALETFLDEIEPVYTQEWKDLGKPRCREDWLLAKYF